MVNLRPILGDDQLSIKPTTVICCLQVKAWAKHHDLVDSRYQRLSSSALALMVIFFLQQKKILPVLQKEYPGQFDPNQSVTENTAFDFSRQVGCINFLRLPGPGRRTWNLLVFVYFPPHKQLLRPLGYCADIVLKEYRVILSRVI